MPDPTHTSARFASKPGSALIILGHGSTENEDSSSPTYEHADEIRRRGLFGEVACAFWKEEPSFRQVFRMLDADEIYIVPDFISEGYFTQEVIPRELEIDGRITHRDGRTIYYCDPVGVHDTMTDLLLDRAREISAAVPEDETSLIIVGHGTGLNQNSTKAISDQARKIHEREDTRFAAVLDAYMEEAPFIAEWDELTTTPNVIVVPFFIADGLHSFQDIPVLLGIEKEPTAAASRMNVFRRNPYRLRGRTLYYSRAIGTNPAMADVILDQVTHFDAHHREPASAPAGA